MGRMMGTSHRLDYEGSLSALLGPSVSSSPGARARKATGSWSVAPCVAAESHGSPTEKGSDRGAGRRSGRRPCRDETTVASRNITEHNSAAKRASKRRAMAPYAKKKGLEATQRARMRLFETALLRRAVPSAASYLTADGAEIRIPVLCGKAFVWKQGSSLAEALVGPRPAKRSLVSVNCA